MSANAYYAQLQAVLDRIRTTQTARIEEAAAAISGAIEKEGLAFLYGSGHSVIPVMDVFPRYGSFVGFVPHALDGFAQLGGRGPRPPIQPQCPARDRTTRHPHTGSSCR